MRAIVFHGPGDVRVETVPDPRVEAPGDAVVRVLGACICGSDLWSYRGVTGRKPGQRIGHEFLGIVEDAGSAVETVRRGELVLAPFSWSDGSCAFCRAGLQTSCANVGYWAQEGSDGGQGEAVRVPLADGTLVGVDGGADAADTELLARLLPLTDVMATGHHAARSAGVAPGSSVAVVGDGAVGLCGVLAAARLGAERILILGRHHERTELARRFGASEVVAERGTAAVERVRELTGGEGAGCVLECVGTQESMETAVGVCRDGGMIGYVGVPHLVEKLPVRDMFGRNIGLRGGVAPVRAYLPELLADTLAGRLDAAAVLDVRTNLDGVPDGYAAMDERRALKVMVTP